MNSSNCPVCGSINTQSITTAIGQRAYCSSCFHGWRTETIPYRYSQTAMCSLGTSGERLLQQIAFFGPHVPAGARILEIGCATGELARAVRSALAPARYDAIELSPAAAAAEAHLDRLHRRPLIDLVAAGEIDGPFDIVLMSHVLEHLEDPAAELRAIAAILAETGVFFAEVPNGAGHRALPIDDNQSHLHFFSATSLTRLLAGESLEVIAAATDARLDARYADSLQVVARPFRLPDAVPDLLARHPLLADEPNIVIWGAGSLVSELLANFMTNDRIDFFIDSDAAKQGTRMMDREVRGPEALGHVPRTVLLASIDFAPEIARDIHSRYPGVVHRLVPVADILDTLGEHLS